MTKEFESYLQQSRAEFCLVTEKHLFTDEVRTAIGSLLIAYDKAFIELQNNANELEQLKHTAHEALPNDCCMDIEIKFCDYRLGDGNKCKHCSNY